MFSPHFFLPCVQKEWGGWSFLLFSFDFNDDSDPPKKKQLSILTVDGQRNMDANLRPEFPARVVPKLQDMGFFWQANAQTFSHFGMQSD